MQIDMRTFKQIYWKYYFFHLPLCSAFTRQCDDQDENALGSYGTTFLMHVGIFINISAAVVLIKIYDLAATLFLLDWLLFYLKCLSGLFLFGVMSSSIQY